jgi:hypothetical protein
MLSFIYALIRFLYILNTVDVAVVGVASILTFPEFISAVKVANTEPVLIVPNSLT